jgi:hypothetical protein
LLQELSKGSVVETRKEAETVTISFPFSFTLSTFQTEIVMAKNRNGLYVSVLEEFNCASGDITREYAIGFVSSTEALSHCLRRVTMNMIWTPGHKDSGEPLPFDDNITIFLFSRPLGAKPLFKKSLALL